jgi:hypothetical protein
VTDIPVLHERIRGHPGHGFQTPRTAQEIWMRPHEITLTPISGRWFVFFVTHRLPFIEQAAHADGAEAAKSGLGAAMVL